MTTEKFLEYNDIPYHKENDRIIINGNLDLNAFNNVPNSLFRDSTITGYLWLANLSYVEPNFLRGAIINSESLYITGLDLNRLTVVTKGFLKNAKINGSLCMKKLTDLPKGFRVDVGHRIYLPNLKSKIIRDLIEYPGIKRELGFNLLN